MNPPRSESTTLGNRLFKTVFVVVVIGVIGSVVYTGSLMSAVAGVFSDRLEPMPFDSAVWKNSIATESIDSVRLRMADDLVANHLEAGMHDSVLHALLGYPDPYKPLPGYDAVYFLGSTPSDTTDDTVWLAIRFNTRGEVQFFKVATE